LIIRWKNFKVSSFRSEPTDCIDTTSGYYVTIKKGAHKKTQTP
jgi:hypothetical protein